MTKALVLHTDDPKKIGSYPNMEMTLNRGLVEASVVLENLDNEILEIAAQMVEDRKVALAAVKQRRDNMRRMLRETLATSGNGEKADE